MKKFLTILAFAFVSVPVFSQNGSKVTNRREEKKKRIEALIKQEEEGVIAHKKHFAYGGKLTSDGFAGFFEKGKAISIRKAVLFQFELGERKHQKENSALTVLTGSSFIFGKINFVYPVKLGVQQQYLLGNKTSKNGVSITANYGGGLSLALLRPYEIQVQKGSENVFIRYESPDSVIFTAPTTVYVGGPTLGRGWNGLKVTPGAYAKTALRFDYGRFNEVLTAIEVGTTAEFYSKKIPQMVKSKYQNFFFSAYVALCFGKRK